MFHQTQIDDEAGWRDAARQENDAQIINRIPHRFYRRSVEGHLYVRPKVTWVISPVVDARIEALWTVLRRQNFTDFETIWAGESEALDRFAAANEADPRVTLAAPLRKPLARLVANMWPPCTDGPPPTTGSGVDWLGASIADRVWHRLRLAIRSRDPTDRLPTKTSRTPQPSTQPGHRLVSRSSPGCDQENGPKR